MLCIASSYWKKQVFVSCLDLGLGKEKERTILGKEHWYLVIFAIH